MLLNVEGTGVEGEGVTTNGPVGGGEPTSQGSTHSIGGQVHKVDGERAIGDTEQVVLLNDRADDGEEERQDPETEGQSDLGYVVSDGDDYERRK
jgi:hypothetical protein